MRRKLFEGSLDIERNGRLLFLMCRVLWNVSWLPRSRLLCVSKHNCTGKGKEIQGQLCFGNLHTFLLSQNDAKFLAGSSISHAVSTIKGLVHMDCI